MPVNAVTQIPAAPADEAVRHFEAAFRFETDCWDTHEALSQQADPGFVLLDVRGELCARPCARRAQPAAAQDHRLAHAAAIRSRHAVRDVLRGAALARPVPRPRSRAWAIR